MCALGLPRVDDDQRFFKVEGYASHFIGHYFRVYSERDLDEAVQQWMRESYEVGAQMHVKRKSKASKSGNDSVK